MNHASKTLPGARRHGGFTLIELVVTMGILAGFLVMLVQLVDGGLSLFTEGETGQQLADRAGHAQRTLDRELRALRGDPTGRDRDVAADRLLVQMLPIGLPARPEPRATRVPVLRAAVHLPSVREEALIETVLLQRLVETTGELPSAEQEARLAELRAREPMRGIGHLLLLPWRQEGPDDALLELRAGWFLPGQRVPVGRDEFVDPIEVAVPGGPELPSLVVHTITTPILSNLLHVEFLFWGQTTRNWRSGAFRVWDSTRGGLLVDEPSGGVWALDRGAASLRDPQDDVHPHAVLVRCVVAQPAEFAAEGLLADGIAADDDRLPLVDGDRFPGSEQGGWIKVDGEWMRYDRRSGDWLLGLSRGQRDTKAIEHGPGVRIHIGRTVEFVVPVPHAKDDWNG